MKSRFLLSPVLLSGALLTGSLLLAGSAQAHAHLQRATPAADSTVSDTTQVQAWFSEALEPTFSTLTVTGPDGKRVDHGDTHVDDKDAKHLSVSVDAKAPGTYSVDWAATSVDTHKSNGKFTFTVK